MSIFDAIKELGITNLIIRGTPTTEEEFNAMCTKAVGTSSENIVIESSDPKDFGVTWKQIQDKIGA